MKSNVFGDGNNQEYKNLLCKAEELAKVIIGEKSHHKFNCEDLSIYSKNEDRRYSLEMRKMIMSSSVARLTHRYTEEEGFKDFRLLMNLDRVLLDVKEGRASFLKTLCIKETNTNLFIYILLHELGHYTHYSKLKENGLEKELVLFNQFQKDRNLKLSRDSYFLLSVKELYADSFASRYIHMILQKLTNIDTKYLTYLD